jgi:hypothetical protein
MTFSPHNLGTVDYNYYFIKSSAHPPMSRLEMNEQWQNLNVFSYKIALLSSINVIPSYFILSKRVSKKQIERQFPNGKGKFITTIIPSRKRNKLAKDVKLKHAANVCFGSANHQRKRTRDPISHAALQSNIKHREDDRQEFLFLTSCVMMLLPECRR